MQKNIIVKGKMGTGKTRNILFPKVMDAIKNKENIITYSTTGEYISEFVDDLRKEDYNVITLNFNDLKESDGWNPLSYIYRLYKDNEDKAISALEKFYKNLFCQEKNESMDDFWVSSSEILSVASTLALFKLGDESKINVDGVFEFISSNELKDNLKKMDDKDINAHASSFILAPQETTGGIISVCLQTLRRYASRDKLRLMLAKTTYDYEDIINKKTAIFIISDEDNTYSIPLINAFIKEICDLAKLSKNTFNIILDEMEVLMRALDCDFTYLIRGANKYNISFTLSVIDEEMLINKLGNYILKIADIIDTNK